MGLVVDSEGTLTFDLLKIIGQWFLRSRSAFLVDLVAVLPVR